MSENNNGGGSDEDDLLSQLLDLEDENPTKKSSKDAHSASDADGFASRTFVEQNDRTEVIVKETPSRANVDMDSLLDGTDQNDRTELLHKPVAPSPSDKDDLLSQLLSDEDGSDQTEFLFQDEAEREKSEDVPIAPDPDIVPQADFLSDALEATKLEESTVLPEEESEENGDGFVDSTLMLDNPIADEAPELSLPQDEQHSPSEVEELDPIDAALADYAAASGGDSEADEMEQTADEIPSSLAPEDSEKEEAPVQISSLMDEIGAEDPLVPHENELSQEDFADVFKSGPIQIPDEKKAKKSFLTPTVKKRAILGLAASVVIAALSFGYLQFSSDEGILGYRLDGFSVVATYRPPSSDELQRFDAIFTKADAALMNDNPEELSKVVPMLQDILVKDVRNMKAALKLFEVLGVMMAWEGVKGAYPSQYDQALLSINRIAKETKQDLDPKLTQIAKAWRSVAVGEYAQAMIELEANSSLENERTKALLGELAFRSGKIEKAKALLEGLKDSKSVRGRFFAARAFEDRQSLMKLASENYLPAEVWKLIVDHSEVSDRERLAQFESLLKKVEKYPWLAIDVLIQKGELLARMGDNEKAREEWQKVVELSPSEFRAWELLAGSYEQDSLWDNAIGAYQSAIKAGGLQKELALRYIRILRTRLKVVDALDTIEKAIAQYPNIPDFYFERGETQLTLNRLDEAKVSYKKALEINAKFEPATLSLAKVAMQQQEWDEASKLFKEIPASSKNYAQSLAGLGDLSFEQHQLDQAQRYYALAIKNDPKNYHSYARITDLLLRHEEDEKAFLLVQSGLEKSPKSIDLVMAKAKILEFKGESDQAYKTIEPYLESHNHIFDLRLLRAEIEIKRGRFSEAVDQLRKMEEEKPKEPGVLYLLAKAFSDGYQSSESALNSTDVAWKYLETLYRLKPDEERYLVLRAKVAGLVQERQESWNAVNRVLELYPDNVDALVLRGDLYNIDGNLEAAKRDYEAAARKTRFRSGIYKKLAQTLTAMGDSSAAITFWKKVAKTDTSDGSAYVELGKLFNEQGNYVQAKRAFQSAIARNPKLADPYYFLGFLQKDLGEFAQAVKSFQIYLKLDPQGVEAATIQDEIYFLKNMGTQN